MTFEELAVVINRFIADLPPIDVQINDDRMFYICNADMNEVQNFIKAGIDDLDTTQSIKTSLKSDIIKLINSANCLDANITAVQQRIKETIHSAMISDNL